VEGKRIQVDEIWSFTYAKQKNVARATRQDLAFGGTWTWTASMRWPSSMICASGWRTACSCPNPLSGDPGENAAKTMRVHLLANSN
jgi:hypothetical protein